MPNRVATCLRLNIFSTSVTPRFADSARQERALCKPGVGRLGRNCNPKLMNQDTFGTRPAKRPRLAAGHLAVPEDPQPSTSALLRQTFDHDGSTQPPAFPTNPLNDVEDAVNGHLARAPSIHGGFPSTADDRGLGLFESPSPTLPFSRDVDSAFAAASLPTLSHVFNTQPVNSTGGQQFPVPDGATSSGRSGPLPPIVPVRGGQIPTHHTPTPSHQNIAPQMQNGYDSTNNILHGVQHLSTPPAAPPSQPSNDAPIPTLRAFPPSASSPLLANTVPASTASMGFSLRDVTLPAPVSLPLPLADPVAAASHVLPAPASPQSSRTTLERLAQGTRVGLRPQASRPNTRPRTIADIPAARELFQGLDEASNVIMRFYDFLVSGAASLPVPNPHFGRRDIILAFRGFGPHCRPDAAIIANLQRADVEALGKAFAIKTASFRRAIIARKIVELMKNPKDWPMTPVPPTPHQTRTPTLGHSRAHVAQRRPMTDTSAPSPTRTRSMTTATHNVTSQFAYQVPSSGVAGGNSQYRGQAGSATSRPQSGTRRQVSSTNRRSTFSSTQHPRRRRDRHTPYASSDTAYTANRLKSWNFQSRENPFNEPVGLPLGPEFSSHGERYSVFNASQLDLGQNPELYFSTPPPQQPQPGTSRQIHLRCLRSSVDTTPGQWPQYWPFPCVAVVNGTEVPLTQAQRYTNGKLAGIDLATNIAPFLRKHKAGVDERNHVVLKRNGQSSSPATGRFVVFVQEIAVKSIALVREQVLEQSKKHWQSHYAWHRSRLGKPDQPDAAGGQTEEGAEEELSDFELAKRGVVGFMNMDGIVSSAMKVSLRCPLMLTRMTVPVKGKDCSHIQCFDLDFFLQYARKSSKFVCPVCNRPNANPEDLVVSPYIEKALEMFDCDEVEISADGSLSAVASTRAGVRSDTDTDGETPNDKGLASNVKAECGLPSPVAPARPGSATAVVDLTLSDNDDPPPQAPPTTAANHAGTNDAPPPSAGQPAEAGDGGTRPATGGSTSTRPNTSVPRDWLDFPAVPLGTGATIHDVISIDDSD